ncbi:MAG TPA: hypothetical protein VJ165_06185 [candidate division Zixibacteria bacterium]|nr:hypothetical protein [candidate division Zixibacteria bacterium]
MKPQKSQILYDPNLIWTCSVDLREEKSRPEEQKPDTKINVDNILPQNSPPDLDNPEQTKIN